MCFGFSFFDFFRIFYAYLNLGQILGLNKFKTWKWNGKHESFLTHSKMKVLENFMFETQNPSSLHMFDFIRQSLARVRGRYDTWYFCFEYV
jgi:beta-lactamase class D